MSTRSRQRRSTATASKCRASCCRISPYRLESARGDAQRVLMKRRTRRVGSTLAPPMSLQDMHGRLCDNREVWELGQPYPTYLPQPNTNRPDSARSTGCGSASAIDRTHVSSLAQVGNTQRCNRSRWPRDYSRVKPHEAAGLVLTLIATIAGVVAAWAAVRQLRLAQPREPANQDPPESSDAVPPRQPLGNHWVVPAALVVMGVAWAASFYVSGGLWPLATLADLNLALAGVMVVMGLVVFAIPRRG